MANKNKKKTTLLRDKETKQDKMELFRKIFALSALVLAVVLLLCMFLNWAAIYNTDEGKNEVRITGFHCVSSELSNNYTVPNTSLHGNMDLPFYAYAREASVSLSKLSVAVMFVLVVHIPLAFFTILAKKKKPFFLLSALFSLAEAGLFLACYVTAMGMNDSAIVPTYCYGNPACSIQSNAIVPAIFAILSVAIPVVALIKGYKKKQPDLAANGAQGQSGQAKDTAQGKPSQFGKKDQKAHPGATAFKGKRYSKK